MTAGLRARPRRRPVPSAPMVDAAAALLAGKVAFVTGTTLHVDGGKRAAGGWHRRADGGWES